MAPKRNLAKTPQICCRHETYADRRCATEIVVIVGQLSTRRAPTKRHDRIITKSAWKRAYTNRGVFVQVYPLPNWFIVHAKRSYPNNRRAETDFLTLIFVNIVESLSRRQIWCHECAAIAVRCRWNHIKAANSSLLIVCIASTCARIDFDRANNTIITIHSCRNECAVIIRSAIQHQRYHWTRHRSPAQK